MKRRRKVSVHRWQFGAWIKTAQSLVNFTAKLLTFQGVLQRWLNSGPLLQQGLQCLTLAAAAVGLLDLVVILWPGGHRCSTATTTTLLATQNNF